MRASVFLEGKVCSRTENDSPSFIQAHKIVKEGWGEEGEGGNTTGQFLGGNFWLMPFDSHTEEAARRKVATTVQLRNGSFCFGRGWDGEG